MPQPPLSDEKCQEAVDAIAIHGSMMPAAASIKPNGLNRSTFEGRLREARRRGFVSSESPRLVLKGQSIFHGPDGSEQGRWDKTKQEGRDPADSVQIPDPKKIVKVSTLYDQQGKVTQQWIAEKPEEAAREALWTAFAEKLAETIPARKPIAKPKAFSHKDLLAVYPVGDHHTGMMAWAMETGGADYDLKIAEKRLADATQELIDTCPPCERALIPFLGDFFHYDSYQPVTPAHRHLLDADGRFPKMLDVGISMIEGVITAALLKHLHVTVIFTDGNHDPATAAAVRIFLKRLYRNEPRVTVNDSPQHFHYYEFGTVLLGTNHGDKVKPAQLAAVMAADKAEAWGRTTYRMWMTGHVHHESRKEYPGCFVESFGVLAPADAYAATGGWRSVCQMQALVFHREHGLVARHVVNPGMFDSKVAA